MPIITVSRRSFSQGAEVAERVADKLGYDCISREVLLDASERYNIPEIKLSHALEDPLSILDRFTYGREKYISYIRSALLKKLKPDNVVYHGYAGHFFLHGLTHVLKTQIIGNIEDRIKRYLDLEMGTWEEAITFLNRLDNQRRKWARNLYGIDNWDPTLFDLVIHMKDVNAEEAAEAICRYCGMKCFQTTPESQRRMDDLCLAAEVKAILMDKRPEAEVSVKDGSVRIKTEDEIEDEYQRQDIIGELDELLLNIPGVKATEIQVIPYGYTFRA